MKDQTLNAYPLPNSEIQPCFVNKLPGTQGPILVKPKKQDGKEKKKSGKTTKGVKLQTLLPIQPSTTSTNNQKPFEPTFL